MAAPKIKQLFFQTEGEGFAHEHGEANSAEKVYVYLELENDDVNETGPFGVTCTAGGDWVSGATHQSVMGSSTDEEWFTAGPLTEGQQELKITLEAEDAASYGWDEPVVEASLWVTVVPARRSAIPDDSEHSRDWAYVNIIINADNFLEKPLRGGRFYARITDAEGKTAAHDGEVDDGILSIPGVWAPQKDATLTLYVDALHGDDYLRLEGSGDFAVTGDAVKFRAAQGFQDITVTASDSQTAAEKAGVTGSAGIEFKVIKIGGEYTSETEQSRTTGHSQEWTIRVPKDNIKLTQVQ
ncbi:hypothetical protein [Actinophytocola algeriensis]|uniref:Uncharacterized protein n=1 Tax=Actinophytocola algeriensis TaxID=1768010 RepID=A0A7W7VGI8_9PSEU|nr:hypothetical protein [Actinophytocola algeriensis]MBB4909105.1 hypothetical protein [Actinophytocola algeriensis]MBE1474507.1 hypothetical protein [Actinophytocola algeriensis]